MTSRTWNVALVGAGFIAETHVRAIRTLDTVRLAAVADSRPDQAERKARAWGVGRTHGSVQELLATGGIDVAHVLTPPIHHQAAAAPLLDAGVHVLVEKPLATTADACAALVAVAERGGAKLAVNLNYLHVPAYQRFKVRLERGEFGRVRHAMVIWNTGLRQLAARQFDHWMFQGPRNVLLESGTHPLGIALDLLGEVEDAHALTTPPLKLGAELTFRHRWQISLTGTKASAQVYLALGEAMPVNTALIVCDDAVVLVDFLTSRLLVQGKTRFIDQIDRLATGSSLAWQGWRQSAANFTREALGLVGLRGPAEPFSAGMTNGIRSFYGFLEGRELTNDGPFGHRLVTLAERLAAPFDDDRRPAPAVLGTNGRSIAADTLVLGGNGFIGRQVVRRLLDQGHGVRLLSRRAVPASTFPETGRLACMRGDATSNRNLEQALDGVEHVIDLAPPDPDRLEDARQDASMLAEVCRHAGVRRLVHAGSIAALYLGNRTEVVTGQTPVDPQRDRRAGYARAKAEAELALLDSARHDGMKFVVLRPGIVIGKGTSPFHSGVGLFQREKHCLGWNAGRNPLPLVLVDDVATAFCAVLTADLPPVSTYNLVGPVRLTAREYVRELAIILERPLTYHPTRPVILQGEELLKWLVKRASGRRDAERPSLRDFRSRGLVASFDVGDVERDLGWRPEGDRAAFIRRGLAVHRSEG